MVWKLLVYNGLGRYHGPPMKYRAFLWTVLLAGMLIPSARAQIGVGAALPRRDYILYEPMMLEISLLNSSGKNMVFQPDDKWIGLEVIREKVELIPETGRPIVDKPIYLDAASSTTLKTNLTYTHEIREPGDYEIQVKVRYKGRLYASAIQSVTVVNGSVQWKQRFAFTNPKSRQEEVRDYELVSQKADRGNRLVARIRDPDKKRVMCCTPVGDLMSFGSPEAKIDAGGTLHVLNQTAPKQFVYSKISPEGIREQPRYFLSIGSPPALVESKDEGVLVVGGSEVGNDGKILSFGKRANAPVPARAVTEEDIKRDRQKREAEEDDD